MSSSDRVKDWRKGNKERYNATQKEVMRRKRAREKEATIAARNLVCPVPNNE